MLLYSCSKPVVYSLSTRTLSSSAFNLARRTKSPVRLVLPVPARRSIEPKVADNHPLWAFFRSDKKSMTTPKDDAKHGRAWSAEELRRKSFDDLHALWIVCLKERNILATQRHERRRQQIRSNGNKEAAERDRTVRRTMAGIKFVLNERFLAWREAVELNKAQQEGKHITEDDLTLTNAAERDEQRTSSTVV